jgi:hypothetical protein
MAERNAGVAAEQRIEFRIGLNVGDIIIDDKDIYGHGVNIAARLEALAPPGGICVSRVVRDQVRDKLDFSFEDMGEQQVKNIPRPIRTHRILLTSAAVEPIGGDRLCFAVCPVAAAETIDRSASVRQYGRRCRAGVFFGGDRRVARPSRTRARP